MTASAASARTIECSEGAATHWVAASSSVRGPRRGRSAPRRPSGERRGHVGPECGEHLRGEAVLLHLRAPREVVHRLPAESAEPADNRALLDGDVEPARDQALAPLDVADGKPEEDSPILERAVERLADQVVHREGEVPLGNATEPH